MHIDLPQFYHFIDNLNIKNIERLDKNIAIIYRNYKKKPDKNSIIKFKNYCKKNRQKFLISNYIDLVIKFNLDGFYLPSFNKKKNYIYNQRKKNFIFIGSAHNLNEIRIKEKQGVQLIFLSPLFKTQKSNRSLGLYRYNRLANLTKLPTIALGGIKESNIKLLKIIKTRGFAAINFFKEKYRL